MRKIFFVSAILLMAILLAACGNAATPAATSGKPLNVKVETKPNPAVMGDLELILTVTDANGQPIEGATVDVSANHTDMAGMDMNGAATEQGAGKYAINANFSMSGNWKLKVYVRKEGLDYSEELALPIQ
jgi:YtkA-like